MDTELRANERRQLDEFFPTLLDRYEDRDGEQDRLLDVQYKINDDATELIHDDDWALLCRGLNEIDDTRAAWLSAKIARRTGQSTQLMGFTTRTPIGPYLAGQEPVEQ